MPLKSSQQRLSKGLGACFASGEPENGTGPVFGKVGGPNFGGDCCRSMRGGKVEDESSPVGMPLPGYVSSPTKKDALQDCRQCVDVKYQTTRPATALTASPTTTTQKTLPGEPGAFGSAS